MNDPNTKYESTANNSEASQESQLLFFNYYEYLTKNYEPLRPDLDETPLQSIVINHYLNTHVPIDSPERLNTRIVCIPRVYHTLQQSDLVPQFSTDFPGREPASIASDSNTFEPIGRYDDNVFGATSMTPLVPQLIAYEELKPIVETVNSLLLEAFTPFSWRNALESLLDVATGTLYSKIVFRLAAPHSKRVVQQLEDFIDATNAKFTQIKFISPRRTGFTSLVVVASHRMFRLRFGTMNGIFAVEKPSGVTSSQFIGNLQALFTKSSVFEQDLKDAREKYAKDLSSNKSWSQAKIDKKLSSMKVKIGHGGTLDPLARGVLVIGVGSGTKKLLYYLGECNKTYETKALLGISTTTGDSEGEILTKTKTDHVTKEMVKNAGEMFVGDLKQTPPIFSALKMNGKPLYDYAREGKPLPMPIKHRDVKVFSLSVFEDDSLNTEHGFKKLESQLDEDGKPKEHALANNPTLNDSPLYFSQQYLEKAEKEGLPKKVGKPRLLAEDEELPDILPLVHFTADVSSGTYIRSLISDFGRALKSSAYMVELIRTRQSDWELGKNVFTYEDFTGNNENVWGLALKEVLQKGPEVNVPQTLEQIKDKFQAVVDKEAKAKDDAELPKKRSIHEVEN